MPRPRETADLARRDVLQLGLAGASALVLGSSPRSRAGETPGIERKGLTEVDATAPPQVDRWADGGRAAGHRLAPSHPPAPGAVL